MKKRILLLLLAGLMVLSACGKKEADEEKGSDIHAVEQEENVDPFYAEMQEKEGVRPIAVMIDNDSDASRPQIGLEDAYLVYEIVVEGKATRLMALFKDYDLEKVGPVRSSRHYFLDYVMENGAIYGHAGWSPKAAKDISALGINNINGVAADGSCFWRDNTYDSTWHNLYTSTVKLSSYARDTKKYSMDAKTSAPSYLKQDTDFEGESTTKVSLNYANFYKLDFVYNEETKRYERFINGKEHASQTGEVLSAKNIILYQVQNVSLNDGENKGRQDLKNIGSGEGYYITNGKRIPIKWSKTARDAKTEYTLSDGTPLSLNPGNTYIQIVPTYVTPGYEGAAAETAQAAAN